MTTREKNKLGGLEGHMQLSTQTSPSLDLMQIYDITEIQLLHSLFFIRMLFFQPRLNILIFLPILGLKYFSIILKL